MGGGATAPKPRLSRSRTGLPARMSSRINSEWLDRFQSSMNSNDELHQSNAFLMAKLIQIWCLELQYKNLPEMSFPAKVLRLVTFLRHHRFIQAAVTRSTHLSKRNKKVKNVKIPIYGVISTEKIQEREYPCQKSTYVHNF
jgi:hypothetical protein